MLLEISKPVALLLCLLSLYAVFHTACLVPGSTPDLLPGSALQNRILDCLPLFALSAGICILSGLLFCETEHKPRPSLFATFPLKIFYWTAGIILILFTISWYLETNTTYYRSIT